MSSLPPSDESSAVLSADSSLENGAMAADVDADPISHRRHKIRSDSERSQCSCDTVLSDSGSPFSSSEDLSASPDDDQERTLAPDGLAPASDRSLFSAEEERELIGWAMDSCDAGLLVGPRQLRREIAAIVSSEQRASSSECSVDQWNSALLQRHHDTLSRLPVFFTRHVRPSALQTDSLPSSACSAPIDNDNFHVWRSALSGRNAARIVAVAQAYIHIDTVSKRVIGVRSCAATAASASSTPTAVHTCRHCGDNGALATNVAHVTHVQAVSGDGACSRAMLVYGGDCATFVDDLLNEQRAHTMCRRSATGVLASYDMLAFMLHCVEPLLLSRATSTCDTAPTPISAARDHAGNNTTAGPAAGAGGGDTDKTSDNKCDKNGEHARTHATPGVINNDDDSTSVSQLNNAPVKHGNDVGGCVIVDGDRHCGSLALRRYCRDEQLQLLGTAVAGSCCRSHQLRRRAVNPADTAAGALLEANCDKLTSSPLGGADGGVSLSRLVAAIARATKRLCQQTVVHAFRSSGVCPWYEKSVIRGVVEVKERDDVEDVVLHSSPAPSSPKNPPKNYPDKPLDNPSKSSSKRSSQKSPLPSVVSVLPNSSPQPDPSSSATDLPDVSADASQPQSVPTAGSIVLRHKRRRSHVMAASGTGLSECAADDELAAAPDNEASAAGGCDAGVTARRAKPVRRRRRILSSAVAASPSKTAVKPPERHGDDTAWSCGSLSDYWCDSDGPNSDSIDDEFSSDSLSFTISSVVSLSVREQAGAGHEVPSQQEMDGSSPPPHCLRDVGAQRSAENACSSDISAVVTSIHKDGVVAANAADVDAGVAPQRTASGRVARTRRPTLKVAELWRQQEENRRQTAHWRQTGSQGRRGQSHELNRPSRPSQQSELPARQLNKRIVAANKPATDSTSEATDLGVSPSSKKTSQSPDKSGACSLPVKIKLESGIDDCIGGDGGGVQQNDQHEHKNLADAIKQHTPAVKPLSESSPSQRAGGVGSVDARVCGRNLTRVAAVRRSGKLKVLVTPSVSTSTVANTVTAARLSDKAVRSSETADSGEERCAATAVKTENIGTTGTSTTVTAGSENAPATDTSLDGLIRPLKEHYTADSEIQCVRCAVVGCPLNSRFDGRVTMYPLPAANNPASCQLRRRWLAACGLPLDTPDDEGGGTSPLAVCRRHFCLDDIHVARVGRCQRRWLRAHVVPHRRLAEQSAEHSDEESMAEAGARVSLGCGRRTRGVKRPRRMSDYVTNEPSDRDTTATYAATGAVNGDNQTPPDQLLDIISSLRTENEQLKAHMRQNHERRQEIISRLRVLLRELETDQEF